MTILFNTLLENAGFPLKDVRMLRHKDNRIKEGGRTPYQLWRDDPQAFNLYQSHQSPKKNKNLNIPYWASFVGTLDGRTMFVGIFAARCKGLLKQDVLMPSGYVDEAGNCAVYHLTLQKPLADLIGKLFIDWGPGYRSWIQRPDQKVKCVTELHKEFKEEEFPGFLDFIKPLSEIDALPNSWIAPLRNSGGIYLFTCPKTKEHYVGSATGTEGFWQRWQCYVQTGHGGNIGLKSRNLSDYQVSILEVAGTAATPKDIKVMEQRWKTKLQTKEMGLNRN